MTDSHSEQTLLTDEENYTKTLQTYLRYMQQLAPQRDWMNTHLREHLLKLFGAKRILRVLAVGTGTGEVDEDFLTTIEKTGNELHNDAEGWSVVYQVIEPNQANINVFKERVKDKFPRISFEWYCGFFEAFAKHHTSSDDTAFDFAHFVRCFYHINSREALQTTYDKLLAKEGIVAVVGEHEEAFWPKQMHFLASHSMTHECFTCSGPVSNNYFLPGWIEQATENGWQYSTSTRAYNFNVTPMLDDASSDGNFVLDFCLHVKQSRKNVAKEILKDFFEFLRSHTVSEGERTYFPCQLGAIIITKK